MNKEDAVLNMKVWVDPLVHPYIDTGLIDFIGDSYAQLETKIGLRTFRYEDLMTEPPSSNIPRTAIKATPKEPTRTKIGVRMDLIPGDVLLEVAKVFAHGADIHGENNWKQSRLTGDKSALNHCLKHLACYQAGIPDDDGDDPNIHLTHAIVNLMFELHYNLHPEKYK